MITQEFLQQCSDEQINRGVAWCIVNNANVSMTLAREKYSFAASFLGSKYNPILINIKNYCANPSDIMPIAEKNYMSIEFPHPALGDHGQVTAYIDGNTDVFIEFNESNRYMRAICEVYILMSVNK